MAILWPYLRSIIEAAPWQHHRIPNAITWQYYNRILLLQYCRILELSCNNIIKVLKQYYGNIMAVPWQYHGCTLAVLQQHVGCTLYYRSAAAVLQQY